MEAGLSYRESAKSGPVPHQALTQRLPKIARHVVDPEKKLVTVTFGSTLSLPDIQTYTQRLLANPSFRPTFSEIVDLTNVEEVTLAADDFLKLADKVDPFSEAARRAFVAKTSTQHHAARMHKALRTARSIEIFHSLEDAEQWIHS